MSYFYNYELNLVDFSIRRTQILKRETRILKIDRIGYHTNVNVSSMMKLYLGAKSLYDSFPSVSYKFSYKFNSLSAHFHTSNQCILLVECKYDLDYMHRLYA